MIGEESPLLFSDIETDYDDYKSSQSSRDFSKELKTKNNSEYLNNNEQRNIIHEIEKQLLQNMESSLNEMSSLPNITPANIGIFDMLNLYKDNVKKFKFYEREETADSDSNNIRNLDNSKKTWPKSLFVNTCGIYYNRTLYSESIDNLYSKIVKRYIGSETNSSFISHHRSTPIKKKNLRVGLVTKSPGNRLSHLAKRHSMFSSAHLLSYSQTTSKLGTRQLIIDTRRTDRRGKVRTPKRRTPGKRKTPGRKTPTSGKKQFILSRSAAAPLSRETSKRALFQSPTKKTIKPTQIKPEIAERVDRSKRVLLFSPSPKKDRLNNSFYDNAKISNTLSRFNSTSCLDDKFIYDQDYTFQLPNLKRKRDDNDFEYNKIINTNVQNNCDSDSDSDGFSRSKSFCVNRNKVVNSLQSLNQSKLFRYNSEGTFSSINPRLSQHFKQKLFWAVSKSLQTKHINSGHVNFKQFAIVLTKVVHKLFLGMARLNVDSTSEALLRIANRVVFWVVQGKSVEEIYSAEQFRNSNIHKDKSNQKLSGYISQEEFQNQNNLNQPKNICFLSEDSLDTFSQQNENNFKQNAELYLSGKSLFFNNNNQTESQSMSTEFIEQSSTIINNNILRENVDTEQRQKSAHKIVGFSGKDQKNISPFKDKNRITNSNNKLNKLYIDNNYANILKAKRQIFFDA